jgi:hypothetical protein
MCSPDEDALFTGILSLELTAKSFREQLFYLNRSILGDAHGWNIDIVARKKTWISVQHCVGLPARQLGTNPDQAPGLLHAVGS